MNNEDYITDIYFRITAYDKKTNKSYIIDSLDTFASHKDFQKHLEDKGLIVLNCTKDRYFYEGNIPKLKIIKEKFIIRADKNGLPRYITTTYDNYHDVLIAVGDKYYIASYTKYYAEENNAIVDNLIALKEFSDNKDKQKYENDNCESDCILCGEDANGYLFCRSCYYKYKDQSILVRIDNCEDFEVVEEDFDEYFDFDISECVICGDEANGYKFCNKCYNKYKNKTLTLKITNCKDVKILEEDYTSKKLVTKDGHVVKSKAEREVDNYLFDNNIKHAYEKEIKLKNQYGEIIPLHPDFCIFIGDKKVYIEYWGYDESNIEYTETKKSKLTIYKNAGLTLINLYESSDAKDIESALEYKLNPKNYKEGKINFLEEI